jgi:23S rRNA (adenine2030-N6)-methyltransferase
MLSYQHGYHAGHYADLLKHLGLTRLLDYLTQKDKPLFYLETHAGRGRYDLWGQQAQKTGEYKEGIELLWQHKKSLPKVFDPYLNAIKQENTNDELRYYPGSPALAIHGARQSDRLYLCELHPAEFEALASLPHYFKKVHASNSDGIAALSALLPPPEKRGLIFIDPSFEIKEEYKTIPKAIQKAFVRFPTGVYCLWYPVVNRYLVDQLHRIMQSIETPKKLRIELNQKTPSKVGMTGSGLWVLNPPFRFKEEMNEGLEALCSTLNPRGYSYTIE